MGRQKKIKMGEVVSLTHALASRLDRSALGRFAIDERALALCLAFEHSMMLSKKRVRVIPSRGHDFDLELQAALSRAGVSIWDAQAEVVFWSERLDDWECYTVNGGIRPAIARLTVITDNPEMHEYFAADIWDTSLIEQFISTGIDAEIARSLTSMTQAA